MSNPEQIIRKINEADFLKAFGKVSSKKKAKDTKDKAERYKKRISKLKKWIDWSTDPDENKALFSLRAELPGVDSDAHDALEAEVRKDWEFLRKSNWGTTSMRFNFTKDQRGFWVEFHTDPRKQWMPKVQMPERLKIATKLLNKLGYKSK